MPSCDIDAAFGKLAEAQPDAELVPKASVVALLVNPTNPFTESETRAAGEAARSLGLNLHVLSASTPSA